MTLECVQSVLAADGETPSIYIVDNGSGDGSREALYAWLLDRFGDPTSRSHNPSVWAWATPRAARITFVALDSNLGYAGGNNEGIRLAIRGGADAVWVLNNDTVVANDALQQLISRARERPDAGIIGACLLDWTLSTIQTFGGARYVWPLTRNRPIGRGLPVSSAPTLSGCLLDYIAGASMFIPASTFREVGLLNEDYFLYGEELDFAERCRARGRPLVVASGARVWHRYGASLGSSTKLASRSATAAFHGSRSAVMLARRFRPHWLPVVLPVRIVLAAWFLARARPRLAAATVRGVAAGLAAHLRDAPGLAGTRGAG